MAYFEVTNITKSFGKTEVLRGIDFSMEQGEVVAIIGSSGSGKTTLLRCLNFLETADTGSITIDGTAVFDATTFPSMKDADIRNMRLHFGFVFQSFNLFPQYTVLENVTLAPMLRAKEGKPDKAALKEKAEQIKSEALSLIAKVGLSEKISSYPCELSGGQQQRVAIARALALSPEILCFDEPTSALDPELTGEVLRVIRDLKSEGRTMIVVTHEMEFAKNVADKIIFVADGLIEEMGTPEEVIVSPRSEKTRAFLGAMLKP